MIGSIRLDHLPPLIKWKIRGNYCDHLLDEVDSKTMNTFVLTIVGGFTIDSHVVIVPLCVL